MKFRVQDSGRKFKMIALELDNGDVPAIEYLRDLKGRDEHAHKRLLSVMDLHKDEGPILNTHVSRALKGD